MNNAWHTLNLATAMGQLSVSWDGLQPTEAEARLVTYGPNELKERGGRSPWQLLLEQFFRTHQKMI